MGKTQLTEIVTFWTGAPLSFVERLCLKSFVDVGHPITLYTYDPLDDVPDGVETRDAAEIMPRPETFVCHPRTGSPAPHADRFRYNLLKQRPGVIWADTDAYCLRPFEPKDGYFFGYCDANQTLINNGVLALPADSPALDELIAYTRDEYAILPWLPRQMLSEACRRSRDGDPMHITEMPWGVWGPQALTWTTRQTGEIKHALPTEALYPVLFEDRRKFFRRARLVERQITPETSSIHLYGRRVRARLRTNHDDIPPEHTILHQLACKHGLAA
ncbi:MAG: hypothetical protein AAF366_21380 [Pseudomonadota bacterium]